MSTISAFWSSVIPTLAGLPSSELASEPAGWLLAIGVALLAAANLWMWLLPAGPTVAAIGIDRSLRGGLVCSSTALGLLVAGFAWLLLL